MADVLELSRAIDEATASVGRLAHEAKVLYGEAVRKGEGLKEEDLPERLRRRLMPEGYEWPRFEDGEPVRFGDEFVRACHESSVGAITLRRKFGRQWFYLNAYEFKPGERVKRLTATGAGEPEPDSWEKWRKEATFVSDKYCLARGIDYDGPIDAIDKKAEDLERRAKALAGQGEVS